MKLGSFTTTVTQLIVEDMKMAKLVDGLARLGIDAENFRPQLSQLIFKMVGVEDSAEGELLREWYFEQTDKAHAMDIGDLKGIYQLAGEVFLGLCFRPGSGKIHLPKPNNEHHEN